MGTQSTDIFDDDASADILDYLLGSEDFLDEATTNIDYALRSDYLGYDDATSVIVSSALIDAIVNGTKYGTFDKKIRDWKKNQKKANFAELIPEARNALRKVISPDSELSELWSEDPEFYRDWKKNIKQLIQRLSDK